MFKNYFIIAIRNIIKYKVNSAINILGFSIALSVVILLFLYVNKEMNVDKLHKNYRNIYRLQIERKASLPPQFSDIILDNFPEIKNVTRITHALGTAILNYEKPLYVNKIIAADNSFFDIFTYDVIAGDLATALKEPASIVLIEQEAKRLFGEENPVGKIIMFNNEHPLMVTAVIRNIQENSSFNFRGVVPIYFLNKAFGEYLFGLGSANFEHYFLCYSQIDGRDFCEKIRTYFEKKYKGWRTGETYYVMPFSKLYFERTARDRWRHGNLFQMFLLIGIGMLILTIAVINFINLSIAKSAKRSLEIGIRKIVGADRKMLIGQFLTESVIICLISIGISVCFVELLIPLFNQLFSTSISLGMINLPHLFIILIVAGIVLGLLAGIYPALYLTAFNPVRIIKGEKILGSKAVTLNNKLFIFQFVISIVLIICTIVIGKQRSFIENWDRGFTEKNMLYLSNLKSIPYSFKQELMQNHTIKGLTFSEGIPGLEYIHSVSTRWKYKDREEQHISYLYFDVDENFLPLMKFKLKEGRLFSEKLDRGKRVCIVNETAVREFEIDNPYEALFDVWRREGEPNPAQVIGVVKDFNQQSLYDRVRPFIFFYNAAPERGFPLLKIETNDFKKIRETVGYIEKVWSKYFPDIPFTYHFLDDSLDDVYKHEARYEKIFISFSILAIVIACLGLLGLVLFITEQRTKEIGIRKVLGASVGEIVSMLIKNFTKWIIIANLIAWPVAYFAMNKWLQNFAYRIDLSWWMFVLAGALALVVALLTVSYQAIRAARANPVDSLRYE